MSIATKWTIAVLSALAAFAVVLGIGLAVTGEFSPPFIALGSVLAGAAVAIGAAAVARHKARERREPPPVGGVQVYGDLKAKGNAVAGNAVQGDLNVYGDRRSGKKPNS